MSDTAALSRQLLHFSPDALIAVDAHGVIRFANETARAMLGYAPEDLVGRPLEMLLPERFRARHATHLAEFHRDPHSREMGSRVADLYARRADGSEFPAGIRLAPFDWQGERYVAAAIRDATERRSVRDALVAARAEAERANWAKSRFLATASHDLRQPMQTIRLLNAAMRRLASGCPDIEELLHREELAIDAATRLLDGLLDVSRLESGAIKPQLDDVPLASVFADLQREFDSPAAAKALRLEFSQPDATLSTDRLLFTQLLQNLIGNALKYTERGVVRVAARIDPEYLEIGVEDTGIGIPADKLERIFDEYYQVDRAGAPRLGVGLGLAIVREVARLLGYQVSVRSTLGEGTRVVVRIPRQVLRSTGADAASAATDASVAGSAARGRLLLVEDNASVRTATELFLTVAGYRVLSAASPGDALALAPQLRAGDLLLADYRLGAELTGIDLLHRLRETLGWEMPAILLSGDLDSLLRVVKTPIRSCRFLGKPVDTGALTAAIAALGESPVAANGTGG
jgi:PAS domain S-box-containing protein